MNDLKDLDRRLWETADQLRANSTLTPGQYRDPILGLIFLAFAEHRFLEVAPELQAKATARRPVTADDYRAQGVLYVPEIALFDYLVQLPEGKDVGKAVDAAMAAIEGSNAGLNEVLPRGYTKIETPLLQSMLRLFAPLPRTLSGDAFGLIYEYFLSNFAMAEGRLGGEFFTPQSIVRLIFEVIEPFHGKVFDPACGSGGMFVQCANFGTTDAFVGQDVLAQGRSGPSPPRSSMIMVMNASASWKPRALVRSLPMEALVDSARPLVSRHSIVASIDTR